MVQEEGRYMRLADSFYAAAPSARPLPPTSRDGGAGGGNAAYSAALRGASLAFQRTTPQPTPKSSPGQQQQQQKQQPRATNTKDDGNRDSEALIAATSASRDHSLSRSSPTRAAARNNTIHHNHTGRISRQTTGSSSVAAGEGNHARDTEQNHGVHNNKNQRSATPQKQQHHQQNIDSTNNTGGGASSLKPPGLSPMGPDPRSPSFIAATLAASRSASPSRREQQQQPNTASSTNTTTHHPYAQQAATKVRRKQNNTGPTSHSAASSMTDLDLTDTTPIPPTTSLISMFEKKDPAAVDPDMDPVKKTTSPGSAKKPAPKLRPVTPPPADTPMAKSEVSPSMRASTAAWEKAMSPPASVSGMQLRPSPSISHANKLEGKKRPPTLPVKSRKPVGSGAKVPEPEDDGAIRKPRAATPPRPASKPETVILSPRPRRAASHKMILQTDLAPEAEGKTGGQEDTGQDMPPEALNPGPRPSSVKTLPAKTTRVVKKPQPRPPRPRRSSSTSSKDTFISASSGPSRAASPKSPAIKSHRRPASVQSLPARKPVPPPPRRLQPQPNMALTSLTNATMAGILASSRASPSMAAAAASPAPPSDDEEEKDHKHRHKKKHLGNKKKHAHHEGARRRWREQITERERKRASTSNLPQRPAYNDKSRTNSTGSSPAASTPNPADFVVNVVARDIWSRSRLPFDELAEVWDLVDSRGVGALDKTEFVVGMWLIDQRLRGRKIPQKVSESVWFSAKGVKVPAAPAERRHNKQIKKK
ncbi:increased rDNA silencing protein 4 [Apiospora kogelbergensis]|uniref:increased rDNA silencing protein 4 n=1 Tax=Apiospora kogelbergensis TaxID=1337665 RepID=UPI00312CDD36